MSSFLLHSFLQRGFLVVIKVQDFFISFTQKKKPFSHKMGAPVGASVVSVGVIVVGNIVVGYEPFCCCYQSCSSRCCWSRFCLTLLLLLLVTTCTFFSLNQNMYPYLTISLLPTARFTASNPPTTPV